MSEIIQTTKDAAWKLCRKLETIHGRSPTAEVCGQLPDDVMACAETIDKETADLRADNAELVKVIQTALDHPNWNFEVTCGARVAIDAAAKKGDK